MTVAVEKINWKFRKQKQKKLKFHMSLPKMCAIVSDITRTEDTESHQGRVCLKDMDLPPTFKDDFHVFGYLSEREDVKKR